MFVLILSLLDLIAGGLLLLNLNYYVNYVAAFMLLKGLFSIISSFGMGYWFDWMGFIDIITSISLFLFSFGLPASIFKTIAWLIVAKGVYCMLRTILKF